jgi:predicted transcriptional regulator
MVDRTPGIVDLGVHPDVEARLLPHIDSFVKWELLRFLYESPDTVARVEDLARYIGRDETEVKPAIRTLASAGFVRQIEDDNRYAYGLAEDESTRTLIGQLVEAFVADRLVRLVISAHILQAQKDAGKPQHAYAA